MIPPRDSQNEYKYISEATLDRLASYVRKATVSMVGASALVLYLGQHMYRDHLRNVALEREVEPTELTWEASKDLLPGDVVEGMYNSYANLPRDIGEACEREAYDLLLQSEYDPTEQQTLAQEAIQTINSAESVPEVLAGAQRFFTANSIEFSYYGEQSTIRYNGSTVNRLLPTYRAFNDTTPEAKEVIAEYMRSTISVMSLFPKTFLERHITDVVYLGDGPKEDVVGSAHDGFRNAQTLVFELDVKNHGRLPKKQQKIVAHEITHAVQERVARENKLYFDDSAHTSFGGTLPDGAHYYVHDSKKREVPAHQFSENPERIAAERYGMKNHREHGATTGGDMFYGEGLVHPSRADFNSAYMLDQVNHALCFEIMLPGFTEQVLIPRSLHLSQGETSIDELREVYGGGVEGLLQLRQALLDRHFPVLAAAE